MKGGLIIVSVIINSTYVEMNFPLKKKIQENRDSKTLCTEFDLLKLPMGRYAPHIDPKRLTPSDVETPKYILCIHLNTEDFDGEGGLEAGWVTLTELYHLTRK